MLLWQGPQIGVAPEGTLSSPVCPRGRRCWPLLEHRLPNFCSSCVLCLFPNQDIAAVTPWEETARSGATRPHLGTALPHWSPSTRPLCAQRPHPTVPGSPCSASLQSKTGPSLCPHPGRTESQNKGLCLSTTRSPTGPVTSPLFTLAQKGLRRLDMSQKHSR